MSKPTIKPGDLHLVVDGTLKFKESGKLFRHDGTLIRKFPCLTVGSEGPRTNVINGDTPPGLYRVDFVQHSLANQSFKDVWLPFGEWFIDLFDVDSQEREFGREGIAIHGGGSNLGGIPGDVKLPLAQRRHALAPEQPLMVTNGCIRVHNQTLSLLATLAKQTLKSGNQFWVTVVAKEVG